MGGRDGEEGRLIVEFDPTAGTTSLQSSSNQNIFQKLVLILITIILLKGTVKEKLKGVKDATWESQALNDTYKTSI